MPTIAKPTSAEALDALRAIVVEGEVCAAIAADELCGAVPGLYLAPAGEEELCRALDYANRAGLLVSPCGGRTKLDWGAAPCAVDLLISTARFNRILEYAPGDMTVTAGAGVSIAQLQSTLSSHRQRLALDPLWPERATVGGIVATNDSGALRLRYGSIRDLIIGITVALPDGTLATSGGKVVKNVAGYDLPKLMSGALGTLGIITRAVFRLHPLSESSHTLTFPFLDCESASAFMLAITDSVALPTGLQMRTERPRPAAQRYPPQPLRPPAQADGRVAVDVRIDGIPAGIAAQTEIVCKLAGKVKPSEPDGDPWQAREQLWNNASPTAAIIKVSVLPTQLSSTAEFVREALSVNADWTLLMYSTGLAWLRVDSAEGTQVAAFLISLRSFIAPTGGTAVLMKAPLALRRNVDVWGDAGSALPLMKRIKQQFDPNAILNRGRFAGGI